VTRPQVFLDTETTSLRYDRRPWEIALIHVDGGHEERRKLTILDVNLADADPASLAMNRFYERHPQYSMTRDSSADAWAVTERMACKTVEELTRGATVIANNPAFDAECLASMLRRQGMAPAWHYKLVDVVDVATGWYIGNGGHLGDWSKSDELSRLCGVEPPGEADRHTAMGDADWVQRWYGGGDCMTTLRHLLAFLAFCLTGLLIGVGYELLHHVAVSRG
jgi:Exonuclease